MNSWMNSNPRGASGSRVRPARSLLFCAVLFFSVLSAGCGNAPLPKETMDVAGHELVVEVAADPEARSLGLMNRKSLEDDSGMLFVFEKEERVSFWMKNTLIPLSIAFISADGTIRQIEDMVPLSLDPIVSSRSVLYALEVNRGWFSEHGVEPGDAVTLPPSVE